MFFLDWDDCLPQGAGVLAASTHLSLGCKLNDFCFLIKGGMRPNF